MPRAAAKRRRTQRERSESTTGEILDAARRLFASDGYQATSLDDIADASAVTKGAIYHHFSGKPDLFRAVFEREEQRLAEQSGQAYASKDDPWDGFYEGCRVWLDAATDPGVQQIIFLDAPAVLGWETVREIDSDYALALMTAALEASMDAGRIPRRPVRPLAHMLFGAMTEASMLLAAAKGSDVAKEKKRVLAELRSLLGALES
jgi:AcrR family transcriptional regulator